MPRVMRAVAEKMHFDYDYKISLKCYLKFSTK